MKKIDPGQTITLLANMGVIASIVFLAVEMRQNNQLLEMESRLAQTEAYIDRTSSTAEEYREFALSSELAELLIRATNEGVSALSEAEQARVRSWELARMQRVAGMYYQYEQGFLSDEAIRDSMRLAALPRLGLWRDLGFEIDYDAFREALEQMEREFPRR